MISKRYLTTLAEDIEKRKWIKSESSVKSISQGISKFKKRLSGMFPPAHRCQLYWYEHTIYDTHNIQYSLS